MQGVGFRPFVYNAARVESLGGWVLNEADAVHIEVQGCHDALERFLDVLRSRHPPQASIETIDVRSIAAQGGPGTFEIRHSTQQAAPRPIVPADLATCRRVPGRDTGSQPAAVPIRFHQLHALWTALVHHHRTALRPAAHIDGPVHDVRGVPPRVRRTE